MADEGFVNMGGHNRVLWLASIYNSIWTSTRVCNPFFKGFGFWGKFALGYSVTTLAGLIAYPLSKIQITQMVHCCTASKAIAIIHDHPGGLWEGYMGGWEWKIAQGLLQQQQMVENYKYICTSREKS